MYKKHAYTRRTGGKLKERIKEHGSFKEKQKEKQNITGLPQHIKDKI